MSKRFRACSLDQQFLLPPSLQDWLPEDHLARFVADVMSELDLCPIYAKYERSDGRAFPGTDGKYPVTQCVGDRCENCTKIVRSLEQNLLGLLGEQTFSIL